MPLKWKWSFWHWLAKRLHLSRQNATEDGDRSQKSSNDDPKKQLEKILKELECPICFSTCTPPIYTCQNGHIICSNCRQNVVSCPTCRVKLTGTRNFFAEHFIAQYSQSCKYSRDGCSFLKWKGDDMKGHEKTCFFRPIPCIVPSCTTCVRYKFLLDHVMDAHKVYGSDTLPAQVTYQTDDPLVADRKWLPYYIKAFNSIFFVMMEVIRPHFWMWVWVQPPKKDPNNNIIFVATLKFHNETKNLSLEWKGPVFSIRTPAAMIIQEGLCFGGAEALLQHFEVDGLVRSFVNIEKRVVTPDGSAPCSTMNEASAPGSSAPNNDDDASDQNRNGQDQFKMRSISVATIG